MSDRIMIARITPPTIAVMPRVAMCLLSALAIAAAALYGSAARRDGDATSDIDILLVRPASLGSRERELWNDRVYRLRDLVQRWTGNRCQVTDRSVAVLGRLSRAREPIVGEWRRDAVSLAGADVSQLLGRRDRPRPPSAMHC
jgi:predicted nucleotidyltransferase